MENKAIIFKYFFQTLIMLLLLFSNQQTQMGKAQEFVICMICKPNRFPNVCLRSTQDNSLQMHTSAQSKRAQD